MRPADNLTISHDTLPTALGRKYSEMCSLVESNKLLDVVQKNRGVVNVFIGQVATPEQSVDMMTFRETGIVAYRQYISTRLLEVPSYAKAPLQSQKLLAISSTKAKKKKMTSRE